MRRFAAVDWVVIPEVVGERDRTGSCVVPDGAGTARNADISSPARPRRRRGNHGAGSDAGRIRTSVSGDRRQRFLRLARTFIRTVPPTTVLFQHVRRAGAGSPAHRPIRPPQEVAEETPAGQGLVAGDAESGATRRCPLVGMERATRCRRGSPARDRRAPA